MFHDTSSLLNNATFLQKKMHFSFGILVKSILKLFKFTNRVVTFYLILLFVNVPLAVSSDHN